MDCLWVCPVETGECVKPGIPGFEIPITTAQITQRFGPRRLHQALSRTMGDPFSPGGAHGSTQASDGEDYTRED